MKNIESQKHLIRQIYEGFQEQVPMDEPTKAIFPETRKAFMNGQAGLTEVSIFILTFCGSDPTLIPKRFNSCLSEIEVNLNYYQIYYIFCLPPTWVVQRLGP